MKKKILITVGYKKRELNYIALLSLFLRQHNFDVKVVYANYEVYAAIFNWQPDILILGQVNQPENIAVGEFAKKSGSRVVVLNCEGTYDSSKKVLRFGSDIKHFVDLIIAWGSQHQLDIAKFTDLPDDRVCVCGTPKFDFYKQPFFSYYTSQPSKRKIKSSKPTICIGTSFASAEINLNLVKNNKVYQQIGISNLKKRINCQKKLRDHFIDLALKLSKLNKYQIIFRPHPLENPEFYQKRLKKYPAIIVDNTQSTISLFAHIDLLIHRSSTLSLEAWLVKIPTITFDPEMNADGDILDFTKFEMVENSAAKLGDKIDKLLANSKKIISSKQSDYLLRWFGFNFNDPQLSSEKIADHILKLQPLPKTRVFHPNLLIYLLLLIVTKLLGKKKQYEILAIFKGEDYLSVMKSLYIEPKEVEELIFMYNQMLTKKK